jgi:mRNA-degrading endonuclease toxin of MazEF toxin-antitoxin module
MEKFLVTKRGFSSQPIHDRPAREARFAEIVQPPAVPASDALAVAAACSRQSPRICTHCG